MSMPDPSSEWDEKDREDVHRALHRQLTEYVERFGNPVPNYVMDDINERIGLVKGADEGFLELHREGLLEDLDVVLARYEKAKVSPAF